MVLNIDGETCHDKLKIASFFNSFFTTVASTLVSKLPPPLNKYTKNTAIFQNSIETMMKLGLKTISPDYTLRELRT